MKTRTAFNRLVARAVNIEFDDVLGLDDDGGLGLWGEELEAEGLNGDKLEELEEAVTHGLDAGRAKAFTAYADARHGEAAIKERVAFRLGLAIGRGRS